MIEPNESADLIPQVTNLSHVDVETVHEKVFDVLKMDKKRHSEGVQFILLKRIGEAEMIYVSLADLEKHFKEIL